MGEVLMLTLLFASTFDLADGSQAAADEVFGLALTLCPRDHLTIIHGREALVHSKQIDYDPWVTHRLVLLASSICERNENKLVTRVVNMTRFHHRVPSGDKLSHIVGLGFPLPWLIANGHGAGVCWESHAVSVESHQSRVRARVDSPFKTKKRRLLECHTLPLVPNYFVVKDLPYFQSTMSIGPLQRRVGRELFSRLA